MYDYKALAPNGWENVSDNILHERDTETEVDGYGLVIREDDTVIEVLEDSEGNDLVAYFNIANEFLYISDLPLIIPGDKRIGKIKLQSGKIAALK